MKKGAEKSEEKSHEAQPCFQGESCLGGTTRAGDSGGTIPAAQGSREPDSIPLIPPLLIDLALARLTQSRVSIGAITGAVPNRLPTAPLLDELLAA